MTKAAKPHCDHANWRNHRPEDDIEVSGASHKPDCSVHYNDPKRLNCNCGLWEAAKPVSDDESCSQAKHAAEIAARLKTRAFANNMEARAGGNLTQDLAQAADTIEALVRENERLQKIEQRAKDEPIIESIIKLGYEDWGHSRIVRWTAQTAGRVMDFILKDDREYIEGDQLQGGSDK